MRLAFLTIIFLCPVLVYCQNARDTSVLNTMVSVRIINQPREDVIKILRKNYGIHFFYSSEIPGLKEYVSVSATNKRLGELLEALFKNTSVDYVEINAQIILKDKEGIITPEDVAREMPDSSMSRSGYRSPANYSGEAERRFLCFLCLFKSREVVKIMPFSVSKEALPDSLETDETDLSDSASEQESEAEESSKYHTWINSSSGEKPVVEFYAGAGIANSRIKSVSREGDEILSNRNRFDRFGSSFSAGMNMKFRTGRFFFLQTGLFYLQTSVKGSFNYKELGSCYSEQVDYRNSFSYLGVPIQAGLSSGYRKFTFSAMSGISVAALAGRKNSFGRYDYFYYREDYDHYNGGNKNNNGGSSYDCQIDTDSRWLERKEFRKMAWIYTLTFSASYRYSKRTSLFVSPGMKYFLSSVYTSHAPVKEKPYSFSVEAGISINY